MKNLRVLFTFFSLVFLSLFHGVFLYPSDKEKEFFKHCPPFRCGKLGEIRFPFTKKGQNIKCGPFVVDGCDDEEHRRIKLDRDSQKWYNLHNISHAPAYAFDWTVINITDTDLQKQLNSRECESFNNLSLPHVSFFEISPKPITLLKCNSTLPYPPHHYDLEYTVCPNFNIYYNKSINMMFPPPSPPPNCSIVILPANIPNRYDNIFDLFSATYSLKLYLSVDCYSCQFNGGNCSLNSFNGFECVDDKGREIPIRPLFPPIPPQLPAKPPRPAPPEGNQKKNPAETQKDWKWKLGLGMGCTAIILVALLLIFFWHRYKRKDAPSRFLRANTYLSKSDLEGANILGVSIFSYTDLQEATNNFAAENVLGDGGFGIVYYGKLKDGREVAVKRLYERNYGKVKQFVNEIEILTGLRHKNLVSLYGCTSRCSRELLLVYEYIPNGTVADHLHGDRAHQSMLTWPIRMRIAIETASALVYLHASAIVHRDVKTNNILLDNHFTVKVADFGLSRLVPMDVTHISTAPQGTPGYVDPEYYQCYQLTDKSDVYSFGVVLAELISSMPAVDITRHRHEINLANLAVNKIQTCAFDELIDTSLGYQSDEEVKRMTTSVAELAFLCLQQDKEMRPAMDQVLEELMRIQGCESEPDNLELE